MMDVPARFDRALAPFLTAEDRRIGLAVSGGGDSLALLHLAAQSRLIAPSQLRVFTVDHGLRAEAAAEARFAGEQARALGAAHTVLTWDTPHPSQSHARGARHRLLAKAARSEGVRLLLTGHTRSDNAESFLMRARAGSGWYGLAGMGPLSASPVWPEGEGVLIARPMLGLDRAEIRSWLTSIGARWCEDPSNEDDTYERVRMRRVLAGAPQLAEKIAHIQSQLAELRGARDRELAALLGRADSSRDGLDWPLPDAIKTETLAQFLSIGAMVVAGTDRPARTARCLHAAQKLLTEMPGASPVTLTLGGAVIRKSKQRLRFDRESNRPGRASTAEISLRLRHIHAGLTGALPAYA